MASPLVSSLIALSDGFASLNMQSQLDVACARNEQDSTTCVPRTIAAETQRQVGFMTLPREIRDQVHVNLVVATDPIQYDRDFKTLSHSDTFSPMAMMWMFEVGSNFQIAREARETFYQHNTFLIYTHDIPALFSGKLHTMLLPPAEGCEPATHSTPLEAGVWVRKLAVRVDWHASGGWFADPCCCNPANDLQQLLGCDSLRSVIIDARFGSWSYGYPQGIGWGLLEEMNDRWGENFRLYNDETMRMDTRRYTSDRRDLSARWLPRDENSQEPGESEADSEGAHRMYDFREEAVEGWGAAEAYNDTESEAEDEAEQGGARQENVTREGEEGEEGEGEAAYAEDEIARHEEEANVDIWSETDRERYYAW